jgi:hypothetical protein
VLEVLAVVRISTPNQSELSLKDQEALLHKWLERNYGKPYNLRAIASQGSGERVDREECLELAAAVESGKYDLVLTEALSRIFRRMHAYLFCEFCQDYKTRLITLIDHVDTGVDNWHMAAVFSAMAAEKTNKDTSEQIKRTLRNRFIEGGIFQQPIFGYIKPPGVNRDEGVRKDPEAEAIYDEWFRRLEGGASYAEVADWLNSHDIALGPYCRDRKWTGRMVQRITFNPILKGERQRNNKISIRTNKTGRRKSVKARPEDLLRRHCPHLAFITPERYDRLIRKLRLRNAMYARGRKAAGDARKGVARKRTVWPGQHIVCGICRRLYYWGGHGQQEHLMCSGCRDYKCWNATTFDGNRAARMLLKAMLSEIEALPELAPALLKRVREKAEARQSTTTRDLRKVTKELETVLKQITRVTDAIAELGGSNALNEKLINLEATRDTLLERREQLEQRPQDHLDLPNMDEIKRLALESLETLATDTPEFGRLMHQLVPVLEAYPYRLCDGGSIVLKAKLTLNLLPLLPEPVRIEELGPVLRRHLIVPLFEPPQREAFRKQVVALRGDGLTERQVAAKLGITVTAAQRAAALQRLMEHHGLMEAYVPVTEAPADTKQRRHLNARYCFERLEEDSAH